MKNKIKELRVRIDGLAQLTKELKPLKLEKCFDSTITVVKEQRPDINSKQIEKAVDSLLLSKAWLGKMLEELGSETPYKNDGKRKTVEDIEPAVDKGKVENSGVNFHFTKGCANWNLWNYIEKVDWLREQIKDIIDNTEDFSKEHDYIELEQGFVYKYLCEARFWLGFELGRIKESN